METYLTIKHLAPYLPYGLKISVCGDESLMTAEDEMDMSICLRDVIEGHHKPILRPLSDYLEINSEAMILLNCDLPEQIQICDLANKMFLLSEMSVSAYVICLENHIDVNRLIPARLAIDINTLSK